MPTDPPGPHPLRLDADSSLLSRAMASLAGPLYLQLAPGVLGVCAPLEWVSPETCPSSVRRSKAGNEYATWCPRRSLLFTLLRSQGDSLVYCHQTDTLYYASTQATLAGHCPDGVGFLCQYCEDAGSAGVVQRLLVFDLVCPPAEPRAQADPPAGRGDRLRGLADVLPAPLCTLQWVGRIPPLRDFVPTLPHEVGALLELTGSPLVAIRREYIKPQ